MASTAQTRRPQLGTSICIKGCLSTNVGSNPAHGSMKLKTDNMEKCMRCGHELIIGGNFMLSDFNGEDLAEDDDAMVTNAHCPHCGASYEIYDTPESEKKNYPYWNV